MPEDDNAKLPAGQRRCLDLNALKAGFPALDEVAAAFHAKNASACLSRAGHVIPVELSVVHEVTESCLVKWEQLDAALRDRVYADRRKAVDFGACAIALLLMKELKGLRAVQQSMTNNGIDYWMSEHDDVDALPFTKNSARLEVSGIEKGSKSDVQRRLRTKENQTKKSDSSDVPAYVVIVEFGQPQARLICR